MMAETQGKSLTLVTLNTWSGLTYRGIIRSAVYEPPGARDSRFLGLLEELLRIDPDVIVLNEVNPLPRYAERIAEQLNMDCMSHIGVSGLRIGRMGLPINLREGDMILAKKQLKLKPVARTQIAGAGIVNQHFSCHTVNTTQALVGVINVLNRDIYIIATHLLATPAFGEKSYDRLEELKNKWNYSDKEYRKALQELKSTEKAKKEEGEELLEFINQVVPKGAPCFLLGDLNAEPDWPEIRMLKENGFIDCYEHKSSGSDPGYTWDPTINSNLQTYYVTETDRKHNRLYDHLHALDETDRRRIDYIFTKNIATDNNTINTELCCIQKYKNRHISDHFGIVSELKLEDSP